jgi:hypothetical protein
MLRLAINNVEEWKGLSLYLPSRRNWIPGRRWKIFVTCDRPVGDPRTIGRPSRRHRRERSKRCLPANFSKASTSSDLTRSPLVAPVENPEGGLDCGNL